MQNKNKNPRQGMEVHNSIGRVHGHMYKIELNTYGK
jgi:6-pyruvoyl-tetrahydropterin synthase